MGSPAKVGAIPKSWGDPDPKLRRSPKVLKILSQSWGIPRSQRGVGRGTQSWGDPQKLGRSPPTLGEIPRHYGDPHPQFGEIPGSWGKSQPNVWEIPKHPKPKLGRSQKLKKSPHRVLEILISCGGPQKFERSPTKVVEIPPTAGEIPNRS